MLDIPNVYAVPSLLILLLALLRACFGRRIPRKFFCILWTAAALRLIIPFTIGLPLLPEDPAFSPALADGGTARELTVCESSAADFFGKCPFGETVFTVIYIAGAAAMALYFCIGHIRTVNRCKISLPFQTETDGLKAALDLRRNVDIRTCENAASPFTYGVFRPVIILPADICGEGLRHILGHELVHIKRADVLQKLLFAVALCIHWINPAVWLLYAAAQRDMEITCDEEAVKRFSFSPRSYAVTLIEMEERLLPGSFAAFGKKPVRERVERLAQFGRIPSVMGAAAGFAAVIIAAGFFTAVEHMPPRVVYINVSEAYDAPYYAGSASEPYTAEETAEVIPPIASVALSEGTAIYQFEAAADNAIDTALTSVWDGIYYIFNCDNTAAVMSEEVSETVYYSDEYVIEVRADGISEDAYADMLAIAIFDDTAAEDIG